MLCKVTHCMMKPGMAIRWLGDGNSCIECCHVAGLMNILEEKNRVIYFLL